MHVPVQRGSLLRHHGHLYFVEDVVERHTGQQRPTIHVRLRHALDGRHVERTLDELQPLEEVPFSFRAMQYLYGKGDRRVFMDMETFEEHELAAAVLGGFEPFLAENQEYKVLVAQGQPLRLEAPESLALRVADTAAPAHSVGVAANVLKEARLENGLAVRVPLFIKTGDLVRISTRSREYLGKG